ncbi:type VII secretion integral membrane protein EccD [Streptomyces sp. NPDC049881]|uniref:type VII secretion integral membrane protein EccD n=1 Tax=Streptomyces sp. NPDC049881 TaxID=3155778 RepID=UPI0034217C88
MSASTTSQPAAPSGADFVRIGLAGPRSRADLAVPAAVPLARLMPALLGHAGEDPGTDGGVRHGGWIMRRTDGTRLDPAASLAAQGVAEGELLFLTHGTDDATPPLYDDVVEIIGEHGVRGSWATAATRGTAGALAAVGLLATCAALAAAPGRLPGWLALATALFCLAVGALMSRAFADVRAGTWAAVLAAPPAMLGAVRLLGTDEGTVGGFTAGHLLLACAVLAAVGAVGPVLVGGGDGTFAALVVAGPLAAVGALQCAVWDVSAVRAASVAAPLALALTTLWPTVALRIARIPAPQVAATVEDLEALPSQLEHDRLTSRVERARQLLTGMLVGSHIVAGTGTLVLLGGGDGWARILAGVLIVLTLLRSRLFRERSQTAVPLLTALVMAVGAAAFLVTDRTGEKMALLGVIFPLALLVALIAGSVGLAAGRYRLNPRVSRGLDMLETTILLAVVPLVLAVWDVYTALLDLRA